MAVLKVARYILIFNSGLISHYSAIFVHLILSAHQFLLRSLPIIQSIVFCCLAVQKIEDLSTVLNDSA